MDRILASQEPMALTNYMETYFKHKTPDISLFSQDNFEIPVHKEVFYQTQLMRSMLKSANFDNCCSKASVICPLQNEELKMIAQFFYSGEIICRNQEEATQMSKNLSELFGFPQINLMLKLEHKIEITSTPIENELQFNLMESNVIKKSRKQSLITASLGNKFISESIAIKNDTKEWNNDSDFNKEDLTDPLAFEMKQEDTKSEVECAICNKIFRNKKVCAMHLFQNHRDACTICFKQFESKKDMEAHISKDHLLSDFRNVATRCVICDLSYRKDKENVKKFKEHMVSEHNVSLKHSNTCNVCLKQFESKQQLEDHISTAHTLPDFRKRLRCVICNILFKRRNKDQSTLTKHMKSEHKVGYECPICQKKLPTMSKMKQHKIQEHNWTKTNSVSKIKYLCSKCGKEFKQRLDYEGHVSKMSCKAWRGKICSICDEKFETMSLRNYHISIKT